MKDFDLVVDGLPWVLSALSLAMSWLTGSKWRHVWLYGLFIQCLWLAWVLASGKWGFLPLSASLFFVYARNHFRWAREAESVATREQVTEYARGLWGEGYQPDPRPVPASEFSGECVAVEPEYRKELWKDGRLIASVPMSPVAGGGSEQPDYFQACRRGRSTWWDDYRAGQAEGRERIGKVVLSGTDEPVFNKHGHEAHCSLMFPATLGTEDDHCDCRAGHDYPACGVFRGGKCSCDASDRPNPTKET